MRRRIFYLLLLLEGCSLVMLYDFQGLRFLFCCTVLIPFLCFLLLIPMVFFCTVSLEAGWQTVVRMEPVKLKLTVENRGLLPVSGLLIRVCWKAPGEKAVKVKKRLYGLGRSTREEMILEFSASHCGQAHFRVTRACLYDYLGIFSLPMKIKGRSTEICIHPVVAPIMREALALNPWEMGKEREGDMFLRDYLPGDGLRRIYWQLSAKTGVLQIRDFEKSGSLRFFLDFSMGYRQKCGEWDRYLDRISSLLYFLLEEAGAASFSVEVVWREEGSLFTYDIPDVAALQTWLDIMLTEGLQGIPFAGGEGSMGEAFCLKEDCRLYIGEQCVYG